MKNTQSVIAGERTQQGIYCGEHRVACCVECGACPADPQRHHSYCSQFQAEHTPGPWTLRIDSEKHYAILDDVEFPLAEVFSAHRSTAKRKAIAKANARLIAAAPELLDALQLILACLEDGTGKVEPDILDAEIFKAERAIAKAEGKEFTAR